MINKHIKAPLEGEEGYGLYKYFCDLEQLEIEEVVNTLLLSMAHELLVAAKAYCDAFESGSNHELYGTFKALINKAKGE